MNHSTRSSPPSTFCSARGPCHHLLEHTASLAFAPTHCSTDSHSSYHLIACLVSLVTVIAGSLYIGLRFAKARNSVRLPPGPPSWPVIGPLHLLGRLPHQSLRRLSQSGDYIPSLEWLDLQGYGRRMKKLHQRFDAYLQRMIQQHRHKIESTTQTELEDFVDVLLSTADDPQYEIKLTDDHIKAIVLDMFGGGTDTSAVTIEWALAELLTNPIALEKLQKELDFVVGNVRQTEEMDIPRLPYLQAVVKETMRLHPVATLLVPHESTEVCEVGGYEIPAKTRLFVNVWAIGRDEGVWRNVEEFQPERFLDSEIGVKGQNYELLPFGSGRRGCPGIALGLSMVHLIVARLVHGLEWCIWDGERGDPEKKPAMEEKFGLAVSLANPLVLVPRTRLPTHLYWLAS